VAQEVLHSAVALAKKYHVNLKHAQHIQKLAVRLFDELLLDQQFEHRNRLLLQVAALLHETGAYVSNRAMHKHSYYIISNSEIFGLTRKEITLVAHVARYHRRSRPKRSHIDYTALSRESRIVVNRLAAILRVADALDASRTGQIEIKDCLIDDSGLIIPVESTADLTLERKELALKSDMLEDIYGLTVRIEQTM
jgi:exopolyphosphatase/guanosine-5'-triphosphate,3'-diphosphate pyrophosphatase